MNALQDTSIEAVRSREPASPFHTRLMEAIRATTLDGVIADGMVAAMASVAETDLTSLGRHVAEAVPGRFSLTGALDRRLLFAERPPTVGGWVVADLSGQAHATRKWPDWVSGRVDIAEPNGWLSVAEFSGDATDRAALRLGDLRSCAGSAPDANGPGAAYRHATGCVAGGDRPVDT
jgi:hypothetical protein